MKAGTFEFFIDDKDFGVGSCIAFAVAYFEREKWWQNCSSFGCMVTCLVNITGGMTCINSV